MVIKKREWDSTTSFPQSCWSHVTCLVNKLCYLEYHMVQHYDMFCNCIGNLVLVLPLIKGEDVLHLKISSCPTKCISKRSLFSQGPNFCRPYGLNQSLTPVTRRPSPKHMDSHQARRRKIASRWPVPNCVKTPYLHVDLFSNLMPTELPSLLPSLFSPEMAVTNDRCRRWTFLRFWGEGAS
jgi:hypothetical protein